MVFVYIGIGVGILIAALLLRKIIRTPAREGIKFAMYCKKCGYRTNGLKCPYCEKSEQSSQKWR